MNHLMLANRALMGKMTKTPFSGTMERASDLLEIKHTDVCGPMSVDACGRYHYILTFTDDLSRYGYIYLMKHKSEMKSSKNFRVKWKIIVRVFELRVWSSVKTI